MLDILANMPKQKPPAPPPVLTPEQCRAARGLVGWSQSQLCEIIGIARATLVSFELGDRIPRSENVTAIRDVLERAGVQFIPANGGGPGVRLKKRPPSRK